MPQHELAQNKEQYEGYTVFHLDFKGHDEPIKMMCLADVKEIVEVKKKLDAVDGCKNCDDIKKEVEELRQELTKQIEAYTSICERLWKIANKKR